MPTGGMNNQLNRPVTSSGVFKGKGIGIRGSGEDISVSESRHVDTGRGRSQSGYMSRIYRSIYRAVRDAVVGPGHKSRGVRGGEGGRPERDPYEEELSEEENTYNDVTTTTTISSTSTSTATDDDKEGLYNEGVGEDVDAYAEPPPRTDGQEVRHTHGTIDTYRAKPSRDPWPQHRGGLFRGSLSGVPGDGSALPPSSALAVIAASWILIALLCCRTPTARLLCPSAGSCPSQSSSSSCTSTSSSGVGASIDDVDDCTCLSLPLRRGVSTINTITTNAPKSD
jgi:hypothetical protein